MNRRSFLIGLAGLPLLAGCNDDAVAALPKPQEPGTDTVAQICGMLLSEHSGPKAQIFLRDIPDPYWFSSVRDAVAYSILPEMPKTIVAFYVNDMARATNWDRPEPGTWIEAKRATFVIGSRKKSGMDADETIPFGDEAAARRFSQDNGGRIVRLADIPADYVLASSTGEP
ncbi:MAG: nitrous oxide reductase accessory protein NosL [Ancalomicrobiaceae bacterium]|nr:nitrous oxide reductase accessory protein NosL [Ancalomicrobiaceae bacterium]